MSRAEELYYLRPQWSCPLLSPSLFCLKAKKRITSSVVKNLVSGTGPTGAILKLRYLVCIWPGFNSLSDEGNHWGHLTAKKTSVTMKKAGPQGSNCFARIFCSAVQSWRLTPIPMLSWVALCLLVNMHVQAFPSNAKTVGCAGACSLSFSPSNIWQQ